jgi:hypothetical protein
MKSSLIQLAVLASASAQEAAYNHQLREDRLLSASMKAEKVHSAKSSKAKSSSKT